MIELQPDVEQPITALNPAPAISDRKQLNLSQEELALDFPKTAKLAFGHVQRYNLKRRSEALREEAVMEIIALVGHGKLRTKILGREVEITIGSNSWVTPNPEKEEEVKEAYGAYYKTLKEAADKGKATAEPYQDIAVNFPQESKEPTPQNIEAIELALQGRQGKPDIRFTLEDLNAKAPKLVKYLYCHFQGKDLDPKLALYRDQALSEYKGRQLTIHTVLNNEEVSISSQSKEKIEPGNDPELATQLKTAANKPKQLLQDLAQQGLAKSTKLFYVSPKAVS